MPKYLFECEACGEFERWMLVTAEEPFACDCGKPAKRLIASATHFKLLGGGWAGDGYETVSHPRFGGKGQGKCRGDK